MATPYSHGVVYTLQRDRCISAIVAIEKSFRMESLRAFQLKTDTDLLRNVCHCLGPDPLCLWASASGYRKPGCYLGGL